MIPGTYTLELRRPEARSVEDGRVIEQELRYFLGQELAKRLELGAMYLVQFKLGHAKHCDGTMWTYSAHVEVRRPRSRAFNRRPRWWERLLERWDQWAEDRRSRRRAEADREAEQMRVRLQDELDDRWFRNRATQ